MRLMSRLAISAAGFAMLGSAALTAAPALAQKKAEKAPAMQFSKEFRAAAGPAQTAFNAATALNDESKKLQAAGNVAGAAAKKAEAKAAYLAAKPSVDALAAGAKSPDEISTVAQWQLEIALNTDDIKGQEIAIDKILGSGRINPASEPALNYYSGIFAYETKNYPKAIERLTRAKQLGYAQADTPLMDSYLQGGQIDLGIKMAQDAIAARKTSGKPMDEDLFSRPALALQKAGRQAELMQFVLARLQYFPTRLYWHNAIDMIAQQTPALDTKLDLFRLKSTAGVMKDDYDYNTYSYLAAEAGLPAESLASISEGRQKVKISSASATELSKRETIQKAKLATDTKAGLNASEGTARASASGKIAASTGDAWLNYGEYAKAVTMYRLALEKGGAGVDLNAVNTRLGIALAKQGDKAGAKAAFAKVTGQRTSVAQLWTIYLDTGVNG